MKKIECSKLLIAIVLLIYIIINAIALYFAWEGKDTSVFMYMIPSASGVAGFGLVFYFNKSKMENIFKGKTNILKEKFELLKQYPDKKEEIENEINKIDSAFDMKIDQELNESIQEDITSQTY
jgi:hypothetical protein